MLFETALQYGAASCDDRSARERIADDVHRVPQDDRLTRIRGRDGSTEGGGRAEQPGHDPLTVRVVPRLGPDPGHADEVGDETEPETEEGIVADCPQQDADGDGDHHVCVTAREGSHSVLT